jgi:phosphatidylglycerophosphate synthase
VTERSVSLVTSAHEATVLGICSLCLVFATSCFLASVWHPGQALRWAVSSEFIFFAEVGLVVCLRHQWERHTGERAPTRLDFPDYVTIFRGFVVSCVGGFIFVPRPTALLAWAPGILYLTAIAGDSLDGYLARRFRGPTRFGEILDNEFDSIATFLGVSLGILYGSLPPWYFVIGLAHYLFLAGIRLYKAKGLPVSPLPENNWRRVVGGAHSFFIAAAISPIFSEATILSLSVLFMVLISASFISDWYSITRKAEPV